MTSPTTSHGQPEQSHQPQDTTGDRDVPPSAGSMPTAEEEQAADRAAQTAPDVSEPYTALNETGANTQGEGSIED